MKKYSSNNPNPIDKYVGTKIRMRRTILGYSQEKLADALGITFQQVQKYENATNRVSASKLHDISAVLGVPVSFFYEGLNVDGKDASCDLEAVVETANLDIDENVLTSLQTLKLIKVFYGMDEKLQAKFLETMRVASKVKLEEGDE